MCITILLCYFPCITFFLAHSRLIYARIFGFRRKLSFCSVFISFVLVAEQLKCWIKKVKWLDGPRKLRENHVQHITQSNISFSSLVIDVSVFSSRIIQDYYCTLLLFYIRCKRWQWWWEYMRLSFCNCLVVFFKWVLLVSNV